MRLLDLFSGIGGFSLAAQWVWGDELEIVAFCEIDKFCQKVLKKHWPNVPIIEDVKKLDGKQWTGTIDLVTGGFPCQPFSVAGKHRGKEDDRYLWPEMYRIVEEVRPTWMLAENVAGIVRMALQEVLTNMETLAYQIIPIGIPACALDADQIRKRIWILACSSMVGRIRGNSKINMRMEKENGEASIGCENREFNEMASFDNQRIQGPWTHQSSIPRVADGIPNQLDRLKSLGNAIVPQVATVIFRAIKEIENG